jgi:hypothetical protein
MPIFKYDNTSDYQCKVCNTTIQRRCVIKHFNTDKHKRNLTKKKTADFFFTEIKKMKLKINCGLKK